MASQSLTVVVVVELETTNQPLDNPRPTCSCHLRSTIVRFHFNAKRPPAPSKRPPKPPYALPVGELPYCTQTDSTLSKYTQNPGPFSLLSHTVAWKPAATLSGRESGRPRPSPVALMHRAVPMSRAACTGPAQTPAKASRIGLKCLCTGGVVTTNSGPEMRRTSAELAASR